ncbi:MAG: RNA-directed DNA polymerase [Anaerolineales bacterium]|nr:RNA-directed DNA polymerase [Anaerolineales bacterium]
MHCDSYANRVGKGTHRAVDRLQQFARRHRYVLRMDIVQHFPSLDHAVLRNAIARVVRDTDVLALIDLILESGAGVLADEYDMVYFPGDDLFSIYRPRGLPIGNLTSQFWSNVYMDALDRFVVNDLGCRSYLRYVDDFALFSESKHELWAWKREIVDFLASLRLTAHSGLCPGATGEGRNSVVGICWSIRRIDAKAAQSGELFSPVCGQYHAVSGTRISFAELDASVRGSIMCGMPTRGAARRDV